MQERDPGPDPAGPDPPGPDPPGPDPPGPDPPDDPVTRNRAQHPRRTPGRSPTGWAVTLRWIRLTAAIVVVATVVLVLVLAFGAN